MPDPDRLATASSDRCVIERELGSGGMATVFLAEDVRHDRKVALKVLRPELSAILGGERFLKEIRTTANLQHPHVLPLHDSGEADAALDEIERLLAGPSWLSVHTLRLGDPLCDPIRDHPRFQAALARIGDRTERRVRDEVVRARRELGRRP